jgi:nucleoid-associated protein YgaU
VGATWTVRPGDTLWAITGHALGRGATAALIARWWPRYWQANRRVIGPNPNLLRPGERLVLPRLDTAPSTARHAKGRR